MGRFTVYNDNITSDWNNVSDDNKKLVKEYIQYCKSNDKSPQTIFQYEEWLKVFFCWNYNENDNKYFVNLKRRDFVNYFGWCRDLGMSSNRLCTLKSVLSSLSNEIELLYEDVYPNFHNQLRALTSIPKSTVRKKTIIPNDKITEMLKELVNRKEYQLACYLALVCSCGARKAELIQMKDSWFNKEHEVFDGYMYCTEEVRSKGRGKQGKIIKKYVIKELFDPFLELWREERKRLGITTDYLFVTKKNGVYEQANISTANSFASTISRIFNISYYTHCSRHFFCTYLKHMNLPDDVIRLIFSWESTDLIKIYDDTPVTERLDSFFKDFRNNGNKVIENNSMVQL